MIEIKTAAQKKGAKRAAGALYEAVNHIRAFYPDGHEFFGALETADNVERMANELWEAGNA